jgi:hypothetical protein
MFVAVSVILRHKPESSTALEHSGGEGVAVELFELGLNRFVVRESLTTAFCLKFLTRRRIANYSRYIMKGGFCRSLE